MKTLVKQFFIFAGLASMLFVLLVLLWSSAAYAYDPYGYQRPYMDYNPYPFQDQTPITTYERGNTRQYLQGGRLLGNEYKRGNQRIFIPSKQWDYRTGTYR